MDVPTIDMDPAVAEDAFREYRDALKERHSKEDEQIMRAYREMAKGTALLRLSEAMVLGGTVVQNLQEFSKDTPITLPKLAVARADGDFAWTSGIRKSGGLTILGKREVARNNRKHRIEFPPGTFEGIETDAARRWEWGRTESGAFNALIPNIPPHLRPPHALLNYHILWEAEWRQAPGPPPGDPMLLKHIGGDLYAILASWDLTPVEQAVLAGRSLDG